MANPTYRAVSAGGTGHFEAVKVDYDAARVSYDQLELTLNITDPEIYVGTWQGDKKIFQLVEKPMRSVFSDFPEDICVWSETRREIRE